MLFLIINAKAQETCLTAGNDANGAGGYQSYAIGQLFFTWDNNAETITAQGIQAGYLNLWEGFVNSDWGLAGNWMLNTIPTKGEDIIFNLNPYNHLELDQTRTVNNIINSQSMYRTVLNGNELIVLGSFNFSNGAVIDGSGANSMLTYASNTGTQQLNTTQLHNQELFDLKINNLNNIELNGTLKIKGAISSLVGKIDAQNFSPTIIFTGSSAQTLDANTILNDQIYNLQSDNTNGITINTNLHITNDITINNGKKLTVASNNTLTIDGQLINNGGNTGFILGSTGLGTASLLHNTNNVSGTAQRFVNGAATAWHLLSSPITGQAIHGTEWTPSGTYGDGTGYDMYIWDEAASCWIYNLNTTVSPTWTTKHPQTSFIPGRGYLYALQEATPTKHFVGNINNGTISQLLTKESTTEFQGFNLIGNPYPSSIDWKEDAGFDRSMLVVNGGGYDTWIWSSSVDNYGVYNSAMAGNTGTNNVTRYIAPMVGFFVKVANPGTFSFYNNARVHTGASAWMKAKADNYNLDKIKLKVERLNAKGSDEVLVLLGNERNENGARKVYSDVKTAPSLSLPNGKVDYTIRYITNTNDNKSIALNFKAGVNGDYTLNINLPDSINAAILEDKIIGNFIEINKNSKYDFYAKTTDNPNRFHIHFGSYNDKENFNVPVYIQNNKLIVDGSRIRNYKVMVYDAAGRSLYKESKNAGSMAEYLLATKGVYMVVIEEGINHKRVKVIY